MEPWELWGMRIPGKMRSYIKVCAMLWGCGVVAAVLAGYGITNSFEQAIRISAVVGGIFGGFLALILAIAWSDIITAGHD